MNGKITYVYGNVLEPQRLEEDEVVVIPHCCNNLGVMGAGVALGIKQKWPDMVQLYFETQRLAPNGLKNMLGEVFLGRSLDAPNILVANMIGQQGVRENEGDKPVKYWALLKAMQTTLSMVGIIAPAGKKIVFHCPKFGSDLAGGKWELIEELIRETWCERGLDVVVYEFELDSTKWGPVETNTETAEPPFVGD